MKCKAIILSSVILLLNSCKATPFLVRETNLDGAANIEASKKNSLDPKGNGAIDPRPLYEKGVTKINFNKGDNNLSFKIKLATGMNTKAVENCTDAKCVSASAEYQQILQSPELKNLKSVKGEVTVDSVTIPIEVDATNLLPDLSHALELIGLAKNSVVKIKGTAYDKDGKILGQKEYQKTITEKVDTVELEILIGNIQNKIQGKM